MAAVLRYSRNLSNSNQAQLYGIITTFPTPIKASSVSIEATIETSTGSAKANWVTACACSLMYKLNNASQSTFVTASSNSAAGQACTAYSSKTLTLNLSNATKLAFLFNGNGTKQWVGSGVPTSFTPVFNHYFTIRITVPNDIASETIITAAKLNDIAALLASDQTTTVGAKIAVAKYNNLLTAAGGSGSFDATNPKTTDLTKLRNAINSATITGVWDSTSSADY